MLISVEALPAMEPVTILRTIATAVPRMQALKKYTPHWKMTTHMIVSALYMKYRKIAVIAAQMTIIQFSFLSKYLFMTQPQTAVDRKDAMKGIGVR